MHPSLGQGVFIVKLLLSDDETELQSDEYRPSNHENNETTNTGHAIRTQHQIRKSREIGIKD